jgi:uncharacterized protein (DUF4415 family)
LPEERRARRGKAIKTKEIVRIEIDPTDPPTLTDRQKAELERLRSLPDEDIDTSDLPEADEDFWSRAVRNPFYRPVKQQPTLRLDADLVAWFKAQAPDGKGYQTAINEALRRHVRREQARGR